MVAAAARHTLALGSARVWACRFSEPSRPPERSTTRVAEGVADLANVRARMRETSAPVWDYIADRIIERFPWLDDDEPDDGDFDPVIVYAGTAAFLGNGDRWIEMAGGAKGDPGAGRRRPHDPLWILEALTIADEGVPRCEEPVRGDPCRRLEFRVDLRTGGDDLEGRHLPAHSERVAGDVWIDEHQRVRRVTWKRPFKYRPRSPFKLPQVTSWRSVQLWDFGIPVDIEIPTPMAPEPGPSLREIYHGIGALWRRRRAYERRQSA